MVAPQVIRKVFVMQRHPQYTRDRLKRMVERLQAKVYPETRPLDRLLVSQPTDRISLAESTKLRYRKAKLGDQFGPLWQSFWFKAATIVPQEWSGQRVDLLWNSFSEATVWIDGRSIQGLNYGVESGRPDVMLTANAQGGQKLQFQIEMACNGLFGKVGHSPFQNISPYILDRAEIALFDPFAWELYHDFRILADLEAAMAKEDATSDKPFAGELLYELNRFCNTYVAEDRSTWEPAHAILKVLYTRQNGTVQHELTAIGHAHIDTAWLWPLAETDRKCERTFSTQVRLMDLYPEFKFACSSAYQYDVIKHRNPDLYERIKAKVANGQWIPVGGTWIEPDCNIPSGENLIRQFLYGQMFFEDEFGVRARELWNPDSFGYNGQLPQIMKLAGMDYFLTQKLSWNHFNKPRYHTFMWEGIDGTAVLTHYPPADTYNSTASVAELRRVTHDHKEHDRSRSSMLVFGWGDGGGGPTQWMIENVKRAADLQGLPRTQIRSPRQFFDNLAATAIDLPVITGELYLEYHRGTYTTQAAVKRDMRKSEFALHNAEFLATLAWKLQGQAYPHEELLRLWQLTLLNDFHDILPGSSIREVYDVTWKQFADVLRSGKSLIGTAAGALLPAGPALMHQLPLWTPVNTSSFARREVSQTPDGQLQMVEAPSYGVGVVIDEVEDTVSALQDGETIILENDHLRAVLSTSGTLVSLLHKASGRQTLASAGNRFQLFDDTPTYNNHDAWDCDPHHLEMPQDIPAATSFEIRTQALRVEVTFTHRVGTASSLVQTVRLDAAARRLEVHCDVDWNENQKFLKVLFPVNVRAKEATYEMQFGVAQRPTHYNTTADFAQYEVPGHKWADMSEHRFGVSLLTESKYGFSTHGNEMRISLLRSPKYPDPNADMGQHYFAFAIMPHEGGWQDGDVVPEGYCFNNPILFTAGGGTPEPPRSFATIDDNCVVIDTIKKAEREDAVVVRLYEAYGARGQANLKIDLPFSKAYFCNILEDNLSEAVIADGRIEVPYTPFQIITIKLV